MGRRPAPLSADARRLATWPRHGDIRDYARILTDALLVRHNRLLIESVVVTYDIPDPQAPQRRLHHHQALARLWIDGTYSGSVTAYGPTPEAAKDNAELFVLRRAVLKGADVPVLGRLLTKGRIQLDLEATQTGFELVLRHDLSPDAWCGPLLLPKAEYRMIATMTPLDLKRGTRYMRIKGLPPDVAALVSPYMDVGATVYLHRLLLALQGQTISNLRSMNVMRRALALDRFKDDLKEGHHLDGNGLNNMAWNVRPLEPFVHHSLHTPEGHGLHELLTREDDPARAQKSASTQHKLPMVWLPVPTLLTRHGKLGQPGYDSLWGHLEAISYHGADTLTPPCFSHDAPPITMSELVHAAGSERASRKLVDALALLIDADGQGLLSNLKNPRFQHAMKKSSLHNALDTMAENGLIGAVLLGGGASDIGRAGRGVEKHYRLLRPVARSVFRTPPP